MYFLFFSIHYADVPFQYSYYSHGDNAFHRLYSKQIQFDENSIGLFNHILPYIIQLPEDINDDNPLVIENEDDYHKLNDKNWSSLTVNDYVLNDMKDELILNDYPHVQFIHIHSCSFEHISSLKITNLPSIQCIMIGDYSFKETSEGIISNLPNLTNLQLDPFSFDWLAILELNNLPKLKEFKTYQKQFYWVQNLSLINLPSLTTLIVDEKSFTETKQLTLEDLPSLSSFTIGYNSFSKTTLVTLKNVPFTDGILICERNTFKNLTPAEICYDELSTPFIQQLRYIHEE